MNDGINPDEFSMHYTKVDQVIHVAAKFGSGGMMAKVHILSTYPNIALHLWTVFY